MKKTFTMLAAVLVAASIGFGGAALAQKKHGPKPAWSAMLGGLSDIQGMTAAMMVFDMKRAAKIAGELQARETYIAGIERLPKPVRDGHAKVADAAAKAAAAAKAGEEQDLAAAINDVMQACNACHYDLRDKKRREK